MRQWKQKFEVVLLAAALFALGGCDRSSELAAPESEPEGQHFYSPFVLVGEGDLEFETISFTDVGLNQPKNEPVDVYVLETIAESLAYKIVAHEDLNFTPEVQYDQSLLDPENHLFCDEHHLYIALWRGYDPDRWGYSLWSGCEAHHEFAWQEVPDPSGEDLLARVEPLTESIVESIHQAHQKRCFTATC